MSWHNIIENSKFSLFLKRNVNFIEYLPVLQYTKYVSATGAYIMFKYNMYVFK